MIYPVPLPLPIREARHRNWLRTFARRALHFAVLWRRMMQASFNEKGDRRFEQIISLRETCRLRGVPTYQVLVEALTCYFQNKPPDVSWR
jgi:transposase